MTDAKAAVLIRDLRVTFPGARGGQAVEVIDGIGLEVRIGLETGEVVAAPNDAFSWTGINGLASSLVWWAIVLIIASFISWLYVLRYIPLNIAYPLSRVVYILVPLGCWIFLGELISTLRWCGIALVVFGLALVVKPIAKMEERL